MKKLALAGLVVAASLLAAPLALAQTATGPDTQACTAAATALTAAVAPVVTYNPNVYPGDKVPAPAEVTPALLAALLADEHLGGGARDEVVAAVAAFAARDTACTAPPTTTTTAPPTTTTTPATTTPAATTTVAPTSAPVTTTPAPDGFSQVGVIPSGAIDTGRA